MKIVALFFVILMAGFGGCDKVKAQTQTSDNLIYSTVNPATNGASYNWTGFTTTTSNGGGLSGGNTPAYNPSTGTFMFGYSQGTIAYTMADRKSTRLNSSHT